MRVSRGAVHVWPYPTLSPRRIVRTMCSRAVHFNTGRNGRSHLGAPLGSIPYKLKPGRTMSNCVRGEKNNAAELAA